MGAFGAPNPTGAVGCANPAVGGVTPGNMAEWLACGVSGFGIGSSLYKPGNSLAKTSEAAVALVQAWRKAKGI